MDQLPQDVKIEILRSFLYKDFLIQFRRFFRFRKQRNVIHLLSQASDANFDLDSIVRKKSTRL